MRPCAPRPTPLFIPTLLTAYLAASLAAADTATRYRVEPLIAEPPLHGVNGMEFDAAGRLIGGSMMSGTIFSVDIDTGSTRIIVGSPRGIADDLAIGPDGLLVWTTTPLGIVHAMPPGGEIRRIATGLPMINSINFSADGRLYAAQVTETTGNLYELDPSGEKPPRVVVADLPGLNGFEITDDGYLYGPLMYAGKIVRIDLESGEMEDIADGFERPVAVNLDSRGRIYAVDILTGELTRIDPASHQREIVARLQPPVDNLAISDDDLVYVSHNCHRGIEEVNPETGAVRQVAAGSIGMAGAGLLTEIDGREVLIVPGLFCHSIIDTDTGAVELLPRQGDIIWSSWVERSGDVLIVSGFAFDQLQWIDMHSGAALRTLDGFQDPYAIKLLPDGDLLVAEYGSGRILRLTPPFDAPPAVFADGLGGPLGLAVEGGLVYVTEATAGRVTALRLDAPRLDIRVIAEGLAQPEGIALLPDGRPVVAEVGARRLVAIDADTGEREIIARDLPVGLPPFMGPPETFLPTGVAVDPAGRIFVTADVAHTVLRISPAD